MREYEIRIREHQSKLPRVREQLAASLVLFVVASLMMTVVTFSWLTLSTAPEVSNTAFMMSSNGNLEIALANEILRDDEGNPVLDSNGNVIPLAPESSQVGDSLKDLFARNTTWGNLVNLSDEVYGLENIVLRPATLKTNSLLSQPLFAAKYDADGRITELRYDFAYTQWNDTLERFQASSSKGVKAISSVKYDNVAYENPLLGAYDKKIENINLVLERARSEFNALSSSANISAIDGIMSTYMNGTLRQNVNAELCSVEDIEKFYDMMLEVYNGPIKTIGSAFMEIIELYQLDTYGQENSTELNYERFTDLDVFCAEITSYISEMNTDRANLKDKDGNPTPKRAIVLAEDFPDLVTYLEDRAKLKTYIDQLSAYKGNNATWGEIKHIVNFVVDIDSCEINGKTVATYTGSLSKYGITLLNMLGEGKANSNNAVVKKGLMQRLDLMLHNGIETFKIDKATITIDKVALKSRVQSSESMSSLAGMVDSVIKGDSGVAEANIKTNAKQISKTGTAKQCAEKAFEIVGAQAVTKTFVAQDTYGLSIDFWVRTNSFDSFLLLEGTVIYDYVDITKNVTIYPEGEDPVTHEGVQIYVATINVTIEQDGETEESSYEDDVFKINGVWYSLSNSEELNKQTTQTTDDGTEQTVTKTISGTPEKKQNKIPIGYTGSNRIWTEEELEGLSDAQSRTTQGAGSCYTYYADPSEKAQINQVLSALKIAFVGVDGSILAQARLATEFCFSEHGKHTVPIMLDTSSLDTGMVDGNGDVIRAITALEQNEATFITAIIYLDGNEVTNDKVLSLSNIEGNFNIQFGSTQKLDSVKNEELMGNQMVVSAEVKSESGVSDPTIDYFEGMNEQGYKTIVTLTIDGATPSSVHAYFLRSISTTQGTKQEKITFTKKAGSENQWVAEVKFYSPGTFILRSVIVDGIERDINVAEGASPPTVTINGFSYNSFHGANGLSYVYRTAQNSVSETFYVNISAQDTSLLPSKVEALFQSDDGKSVTVNFTDANHDTEYEGTATFRSSGTYTCKYLIIDGEYYELTNEITREVYTGLKVSVWLSQDDGDTFDPLEEAIFSSGGYQYIHKGLSHEFNVQMRIYDSSGNAIEGLTNVSVYYSRDTDANLRWDSTTKYYVGELPVISSPGIYSFERAEVGFETIDSTKSAMYIRAIPSDPVSYLGTEVDIPNQIITLAGYDDEEQPQGAVVLKFKNAESATVFGKFSKTTSDGTTSVIIPAKIAETVNDEYVTFKFILPDKNGLWKLEEVKMSGVYDDETQSFLMVDENGVLESLFKNGEQYSPTIIKDENGSVDVWDMATDYYVVDSDWSSTVILNTLDSINPFLNCADNDFMDPYSITNAVKINNELSGVEGVTLEVSYITLTYSHTASGSITWAGDDKVEDTVNVLSGSGNTFNESLTLYLPGSYSVTLSYKLTLNGQEYVIERPVNQFTLSYKLPTVKITAITPEGTHSYDNKDGKIRDDEKIEGSGCDTKTVYYTSSAHTTGAESKIHEGNLKATVYFKCNHDEEESSYDYRFHNYAENGDGKGAPSVTLALEDINKNNFTKATLSFTKETEGTDTTVHMYKTFNNNKSSDPQSYYSWTPPSGDETEVKSTMFIGYMVYDNSKMALIGSDSNTKTSAGTLKSGDLVIECKYGTFNVQIPTIVIENPN